jgi:large subunit ribosomal protein L23
MTTIANYDKIKGLIYTEKSNKHIAEGKYCFEVDKSCNKQDLKSLVKLVFGVEVEKVNIANVTGKTKRFRGILGKKKSYKKATVTIKEGQSINFQGLK